MSVNEHDSPKSNIEDNNIKAKEIKKPNGVWLVALWMLFKFGMLIIGLGGIASGTVNIDYMAVKIVTIIALVVLCILVFGVIKLNKIIIITTAYIFIAFGTYQVYNFIMAILGNAQPETLAYLISISIIPSFICAWYLLSSNLRNYINYKAA